MTFLDIEQGTEEWFQYRAGKLTSSNIGKVMANYGKAFGEPAKQLAVNIALEQITWQSLEGGYTNDHMDRGVIQEPIARSLYEVENFCTVTNGGFFDCGFLGCSPDGLVGKDGCIEIKSALPHIHYARVKRGELDPAYKWQCISNLKLTGCEWLDFVSYCESFPMDGRLYICRIRPKDLQEEFEMLDARIEEFRSLVEKTKETITQSEYRRI